MYKKVIPYEDLEGNKREKTCYFNFTKAELYEKHLVSNGTLVDYLKQIYENKDAKQMVDVFKKVIYESYGERNADGEFYKFDENRHRFADKFIQTAAYSELFMELATNEESAKEFVMGIVPRDLLPDGGIPFPSNK